MICLREVARYPARVRGPIFIRAPNLTHLHLHCSASLMNRSPHCTGRMHNN